MNVLQSYTDFDWDDLPMDEEEYDEYKAKYLDLYDKVKQNAQKNILIVLQISNSSYAVVLVLIILILNMQQVRESW